MNDVDDFIMLHVALRIAAQGKEQAHHARVHPVEGMELSPPSFTTTLHLNPSHKGVTAPLLYSNYYRYTLIPEQALEIRVFFKQWRL